MKRLVVFVLLLSVSVTAQSPAPSVDKPAPVSEVERLQQQVALLEDDLAAARAARADCEMTLGPVEAGFRRQASQQRWNELKAAMEKARGGRGAVRAIVT